MAAAASAASSALAAPPVASLRPVLRGAEFFKRAVPDLATIIRDKKLTGTVAYAVADVATGRWLECVDEHRGIPPASVTKAITALYALDVLGPLHRFETRVLATGGISNGEVLGDLILVGGGDPTLDTNGLAALAAKVKEAGVIGVKGGFKVYQGDLPALRQIDPEQPDHVGYNPAVSGLALNFNRVHFEWKRASGHYAVSMEARSDRYRPAVGMAVMSVVDRKAPVYTYEDRGGKDRWTVAKGALGKGGSRWLPVRRPAVYAGEVFATMLGANGIRVKRAEVIDALPENEQIAVLRSGPLNGILQDMLRFSTNLTAEMVGLSATLRRRGKAADLAASAGEMNAWARDALRMRAPQLVDHSGLGDASRLMAVDMTRALVAAKEVGLRPILKKFQMRDAQGKPQKDHPVAVDAKTGTLNFVSALAGYMTVRDGTELAFAIFAANEALRAEIPREERERPPGARTWNRRAKQVQQALIERWDVLFTARKS